MKKHLYKSLILICGLALLSSCMKDDPKNNETVYYGYQQIPNINEFMPQTLLLAFGNNIHFGDEPPKIEGTFVADNILITDVLRLPTSPWNLTPTTMPGSQYFEIFEQHKGIAKMRFRSPKGRPGTYEYFVESSDPDSTYSVVTSSPEFFINDSIAPSYFQDGKYQKENFNTVYIIGEQPYFTIFYYEVRNIRSKAQPLNAVIISGKLDKEITIVNDTVNHVTDTVEKPVIRDFKWCIETMKYYKEGTSVSQIISFGLLPSKGDAMILKNDGIVHTGEFHE